MGFDRVCRAVYMFETDEIFLRRRGLAGLMLWLRYRRGFLGATLLMLASFPALLFVILLIDSGGVVDFAFVATAVCALLVTLLFIVLLECFGWLLLPAEERMRLKWEQRQRDLAKVPFLREQRCQVSATEAVWVRHRGTSDEKARSRSIFEVLYSKDGGQTWQELPLHLSLCARVMCTVLDPKWPPYSGSRNLGCNSGRVSFEMVGKRWLDGKRLPALEDPEYVDFSIWRATYHPRRKRWTIKFVGMYGLGWID
jgi:hypothetical protein